MSEDKKETLNKEAKEFIPTKNRVPEKLKFNENAKEYVPKEQREIKPKIKTVYIEGDDEMMI